MVVVDSITRKEAIELGYVKVKILLEYLFELSSKSKTMQIYLHTHISAP